MTRQVHVAILHYAAPPIIGGVETTIYYHALHLSRLGYRVTVIAGRGAAFAPQVDFIAEPMVDSRFPPLAEVNEQLAQGEVSTAFDRWREHIYQRLRERLQGVQVLIVHNALTLHKNLPLTAALHRLAQEGFPIIGWCHDFAWQDALYIPVLRDAYPWNLLKTPWPGVKYVVVSEHRREQLARLLNLPAQEISVVPPGVEPTRLLRLSPDTQRLADRLRLWEADPLFILPARITRRKNIQFALRMLAALRGRWPDPMLVVTGPPGPHNPTNVAYLEQLMRLRQELALQAQVHFLYQHGEQGKPLEVSEAVLAELYLLADALLFPSLREGFGIPVLEAGLLRLPIFAADIPPVRESAGDLAVTFDPEGSPEEAAERVASWLAQDPIYAMRRRVKQRYIWAQIVRHQVVPLIESVLRSEP
ncbi:MAG TPA: glycosyltransferase family 4 protein [Anaerolineae bacterium]|nr:glycosyltransferase family 4 protein [Anaerolineae bacterium]HID84241.1 glycosyltransferase [Anaerolineales bacterium]HIQ09151.1 glycosyltransferase [Anaerolineaceae bacterium]